MVGCCLINTDDRMLFEVQKECELSLDMLLVQCVGFLNSVYPMLASQGDVAHKADVTLRKSQSLLFPSLLLWKQLPPTSFSFL